jgi:hypothetical protein
MDDKKVEFQEFKGTDNGGVCGPDGCNIAEHRQKEKEHK